MKLTKSQNFKEFLKNHRYTYRAFGRKVGVTGQAVLHWVNGRSLPEDENATKILETIAYDERCTKKQAERIFYKTVDKK